MPPTDLPIEESFRRALRFAMDGDDSDYMIETLLAVVSGNEELERIAVVELAPRAAHLELHFDGANVHEHSANARSFGAFVVRISEAVKEFVKDRLSLPGFTADLMIAPGEGSVRATFIAPDPVDIAQNPFADFHPEGPIWTDVNLQSEALHQIAVVLMNSDPDSPESEVLDGAIQQLPMKSRKHLRTAIKETVKQDWTISGEFRQRGVGVEPIEMKPASARFLLSRLVEEEVQETDWVTTGVLDGHTWSNGVMYLIPSDRSRRFPASFADSDIQQQVAALDAVEGQRVEATFKVFTRLGSGDGDNGKRSYVLQAIRALDAGPDTRLDIQ